MVRIDNDVARTNLSKEEFHNRLRVLASDIIYETNVYNTFIQKKKSDYTIRLVRDSILFAGCQLIELCCFGIARYLFKLDQPLNNINTNRELVMYYGDILEHSNKISEINKGKISVSCAYMSRLIRNRNEIIHKVYLPQRDRDRTIQEQLRLLTSSEQLTLLVQVILTYNEYIINNTNAHTKTNSQLRELSSFNKEVSHV